MLPAMTLREWLKSKNYSLQQCADRLGRDHSVVVRYCKRQVNPSPEVIADIMEWSGGEITVRELLADHAAKDRAA